MSICPASGFVKRARRRGRLLALAGAAALLAGCATVPFEKSAGSRQALRTLPPVPAGHARADRALVAAFFAANGIPLTIAQAEQIIPAAAPPGRMDRNVLRRLATAGDRLLLVVKADEPFLWDELGRGQPLLILLPPGPRYSPGASPLIPVAWDRAQGVVELLDGNGEIQRVPENDFFDRREPLKQAALVLVRPGHLARYQPTREQKLLLADFWYDQGFYRRARRAYDDVQKEAPAGDVAALIGRGNVLFRQNRYEDAIPVFRAALALEPDNPRILNNLAYAMLHGDGELLAALRHARKADQLDPNNPLILETIGSINLRLGDALAAANYLEQAWARASKHSPEVQIAIMDQLVRAWHAADRNDLAWQVAEHRKNTFPNYKIPRDILFLFPSLRDLPEATEKP